MKYSVTFETRNTGAIGVFEPRTVTVEAASPREAVDVAGDKLSEDGTLETRSPIRVEQDGKVFNPPL